MEEKKNVNLFNFGADLSENIIKDIESEHNINIKEIRIKASLNLKKHSTYIQVSDLVKANKNLLNDSFFIVNLPGLPIFAACLITEIHALCSKFPVILECIKDYSNDGIFSSYKYKRLYNLELERVQSRENYKQSGNR